MKTSERKPGATLQVRPIEILLVDDHTLFRESLRRLLDGEPGFHVCGDFATSDEALLALSKGLSFDVALIDYELTASSGAAGNGLDLLRRIRNDRPDARVLMVTAGMEMDDLQKTVKNLNAGIFLKIEPTTELMLAIQRTAKGERWISSAAALMLLSAEDRPQNKEHLSPRESGVLRGVLEGLSNKEIGFRLNLTESSVKAVLQKLFEKTGVRSRSQLVRYAIEAQIDLG
jgi:DNA-binding NarL/FixJ family response regulator